MYGIQTETADLRAIYRKNGSTDLIERLSQQHILFLRRYYPLRFLRIVAQAEKQRSV